MPSSMFIYFFLQECKTEATSSPTNYDPNKPCVFPFDYNGVTHTKCTTGGANGVFWCATEGYTGTRWDTRWGTCEERCPKEDTCNLHIIYIDVDMSYLLLCIK